MGQGSNRFRLRGPGNQGMGRTADRSAVGSRSRQLVASPPVCAAGRGRTPCDAEPMLSVRNTAGTPLFTEWTSPPTDRDDVRGVDDLATARSVRVRGERAAAVEHSPTLPTVMGRCAGANRALGDAGAEFAPNADGNRGATPYPGGSTKTQSSGSGCPATGRPHFE